MGRLTRLKWHKILLTALLSKFYMCKSQFKGSMVYNKYMTQDIFSALLEKNYMCKYQFNRNMVYNKWMAKYVFSALL